MIRPRCCKCKDELKEYGGILLSPPDGAYYQNVQKWHLCKVCYILVEKFINPYPKPPKGKK